MHVLKILSSIGLQYIYKHTYVLFCWFVFMLTIFILFLILKYLSFFTFAFGEGGRVHEYSVAAKEPKKKYKQLTKSQGLGLRQEAPRATRTYTVFYFL